MIQYIASNMITNTGKAIISKYLIGQAPAYASYMAIGCGAIPLSTVDQIGDYSNQKSLNFEMFRVPIISKGYVNEDGIDKIVFTAELPTEERYEISEIGIYSAASNPDAVNRDSKILYSFTQSENWEYHSQASATSIPIIYEPLDSNSDNIISNTYKVFQTNADNRIFTDQDRLDRYERCRFLNNIIVMRGDSSTIDDSGTTLVPTSGDHIHLNGISINLDRYSPLDQIRLAFSVINKDGNSNAVPEKVLLIVEADSQDEFGAGQSIKLEVDLANGTGGHSQGEHDFSNNRYVVFSKSLEELYKTSGFAWNLMNVFKVYASVIYNSEPSDLFYVCLDSIRVENVTDTNPLYGLVAYSVIQTPDSQTVIKRANTSNFIEFRTSIGVQ